MKTSKKKACRDRVLVIINKITPILEVGNMKIRFISIYNKHKNCKLKAKYSLTSSYFEIFIIFSYRKRHFQVSKIESWVLHGFQVKYLRFPS